MNFLHREKQFWADIYHFTLHVYAIKTAEKWLSAVMQYLVPSQNKILLFNGSELADSR